MTARPLFRWLSLLLLGPTLVVPVQSWHTHLHSIEPAGDSRGDVVASLRAEHAPVAPLRGGDPGLLCAACAAATLTAHTTPELPVIVGAAPPSAPAVRPACLRLSTHRLPICVRGPPLA